MIMLKKPLQLKSLFEFTDISFAFAEKIQANYIFMTAAMPKEELVHLLTEEADEQGQISSVTMLVENFTAINQNEIMIKLLNQVINRILAAGENRITYQDNVYITCILNKLGITDIKTFIRRVKNSREELFLKNQLLEKYEKDKTLLKTFYQSSMHSTEKAGKAVYQESEKKEENYLYEKVITRLHTAEIYQTVSEFNYAQGMGQKYIFHRELELSEQKENMLNIRLMQAKKELVNPHFQIELFHTNLYEAELMQGSLNVKENVLISILRAAVFSLVKSFSLAELFRRNYYHLGAHKRWLHHLGNQRKRWLHHVQTENDWYEAGFEICNTAKNTINRCQWYYQKQLELSSDDIQIFSEQRNKLYRYELKVLQKITETEKNSKNSSLMLKYKKTDNMEAENHLQAEDSLSAQNEGGYRTEAVFSELKENKLKTENVFLKLKENELKTEEDLQNAKDEKEDSLQTEEILLRLKEIMRKDSAETPQSFKQPYKEGSFQSNISVQEVRIENRKSIVHEEPELENTAIDFYYEIQSLAMVQNYFSKFFGILREETEKINTKGSSDFRESVERMNQWIEESFFKNSENKSLSYRVFQDMEKRKDTIIEHYYQTIHLKEIQEETDKENIKQTEKQRIQRKDIYQKEVPRENLQQKNMQREMIQQKAVQKESLQQRKTQEENIQEKQIQKELQKEIMAKKHEIQKEMLNEKEAHRQEIEEENRHKKELWKENTKEKELQKDIIQKKEAEQIEQTTIYEVDEKQNDILKYSVTNNEISVFDRSGQKEKGGKEDIDNIQQHTTKKEASVLDKPAQKESENQEKNKKEILQIFHEIESENLHNTEQTAIKALQESQMEYFTSSEASKKTLSTFSSILEVSQKETDIQKNNAEIIQQQKEKQSELQSEMIQKKTEKDEVQNEIAYHKEIRQSKVQNEAIQPQEEEQQDWKIFHELEQNQTIYNQSGQIVQSTYSDYMDILEQYNTYQSHIIQNLANQPSNNKQINSVLYINQEEQGTKKEQMKESSQKESIQHVFDELETQTIQGPAQKSIRKISKTNGYSDNKKAEIVYRRRQQDTLEADSRQRINKTEQKTEKTVYHNRINLPETVRTSIQNKTKTETNQINEIKQFIQSSIQKQINQITDQVYKKIEKKLQNERRRRGL